MVCLLCYVMCVQELGALSALDGIGGGVGGTTGAASGPSARPSMLGGTTAFTPVDIPVGPAAASAGAGGGGGAAAAGAGAGGGGEGAREEEVLPGWATRSAPPSHRGTFPRHTHCRLSVHRVCVAQLPDGARIEYWWNEEWGWCAATVQRRLRGPAGEQLHTLLFDSDGSWEDVRLSFDDGGRRWRPLR